VALFGLGGIGKTNLVAEYCYRFASEYDVVWWVRAENASSIAADLASLASHFGVIDAEAPTETRVPARDTGSTAAGSTSGAAPPSDKSVGVVAALQWLATNRRWLLVFDNAPDAASLLDYFPAAGNGHVIVTSRSPAWGKFAVPLEVEPLSRDEGLGFLHARLGPHVVSDSQSGLRLVDALGSLPLALEQAASFIETTAIALPDYLDLILSAQDVEQDEGVLLAAVRATWSTSLTRLRDNGAAVAFLDFCAWLSADGIPRDLIVHDDAELPPLLKKVTPSRVRFAEVVGELRRYSLIGVHGDTFTVHRLVQRVVRAGQDQATRTDYLARALHTVSKVLPDSATDSADWPKFERYLANALTAAQHAREEAVEPAIAAELLWRVGDYHYERARFTEARRVLDDALALAHGVALNSPLVADIENSIGNVLESLGDRTGARVRYEKALAINLEVGPEPDVSIRLNNLGYLAERAGLFEDALEKYARALEIDFRHRDDLEPAETLVNLGSLYSTLGRSTEAREHFERALRLQEEKRPPNKADIAIILSALGELDMDAENFGGAKTAFERAHKLDLEWYHPDDQHPAIAVDLLSLGRVHLAERDTARAREFAERALVIQQKRYGGIRHREIASSYYLLGEVATAEGKFDEAVDQFQLALENDEGDNGEKAADLEAIADALVSAGRSDEATTRLQHAVRLVREIPDSDERVAELEEKLSSLIHGG
jgi:tetratricopeptide (TPR) repeat protein